jgi:putative membrane protein
MRSARTSHLVLLVIGAIVFAWSGWRPYDRFTWWLEIAPALAAVALLLATYRRFQFTTLCYVLMALHICVLCVGGHYTYARVPAFDWLRVYFGWERNHYDRLGHFMQGFVPAIIAREIFVRLDIVKRKTWRPFLIVAVCLAISAFYELTEWWAALINGDAANDFLGSQGDPWDTQADMLIALLGASSALLLLSPFHDRALRHVGQTKNIL